MSAPLPPPFLDLSELGAPPVSSTTTTRPTGHAPQSPVGLSPNPWLANSSVQHPNSLHPMSPTTAAHSAELLSLLQSVAPAPTSAAPSLPAPLSLAHSSASPLHALPVSQPLSQPLDFQSQPLPTSMPLLSPFETPPRTHAEAHHMSSETLPPSCAAPVTAPDLFHSLGPLARSLDGLSAVDRAKKSADRFTITELGKKRRAAGLDPFPKRTRNGSSSKSASSEDDAQHDDVDLPERVSHRKYQKRLQKNRDSAFVSRIRRREYTRILEESLNNTEKEKEAAVGGFLEMKRRFDIVSAELNAFKQAAASNLYAVRDSVVSRLSTTTVDSQPARSGGIVTTMFMFSILFGIMLPECLTHRSTLQRYTIGGGQHWSDGMTDAAVDLHKHRPGGLLGAFAFSHSNAPDAQHRGKVWSASASPALGREPPSEEMSSHSSVNAVLDGAAHVLGSARSKEFIELVAPYVGGLSAEERGRLHAVFSDRNCTLFTHLAEIESLVRKAGKDQADDGEPILDYVTAQLENVRL